jgi:hypothetical protein
MNSNRLLIACNLLIVLSCSNAFIERTASTYFPLDEGNWWRYADSVLYNPSMVFLSVEAKDTVMQVECFRVSWSGDLTYYMKSDEGIREYVKIVHNISGVDHTIAEGFVLKTELPFVAGNHFQDVLCDSLELSGIKVKARYAVDGFVSDYEDDELYGSVYRLIIAVEEIIELPDTVYAHQYSVDEYYAPDIGLVRFRNDKGFFSLIEYDLQ